VHERGAHQRPAVLAQVAPAAGVGDVAQLRDVDVQLRKAENIRAALDGELSFYAQVWGFDLPAGEGFDPIDVVRAAASR
jgi:hypothetical protein